MHDDERAHAASPPLLLAEETKILDALAALDPNSKEDEGNRRRLQRDLDDVRVRIARQPHVSIDTLLADPPAEKAARIRAGLAMLGAQDITYGWPCICCDEITHIKLYGVPVCSGCGVNLIEERGRLAKRGQPLPPWKRGVRCNRRGHRRSAAVG
jgi:hypothetical protein